jgi:hypothetical protein
MKKELNQIIISKEKVIDNISLTLSQIKTKGLYKEDMQLVEEILNGLSGCYRHAIDNFIREFERSRNRLDKIELNNDVSDRLPKPSLSDCLKKFRDSFYGAPINFFPSNTKGPCHPQCLVMSSGDWEFGDTKMRNDILGYWYRCFYKNRFTLIFSESWQSVSWDKWQKMIDAYVAEQKFEVKGNSEDVDHTVIVIEYSNDMVHLRYHETSILNLRSR